MAAFVLVHGAWHGGWCWEPLRQELVARGHQVVTSDLPTDDPAAHIDDFAAVVGPRPDAVVVGHSYGGLVLPLLEARLHVYLCALVPTPGRPSAEIFGEALEPDFGGTERDELGRTYWPNVDVAAYRLYHGHAREWAEWAFPQLRPQAQTAAGAPHPLREMPDVPAAYVLARDDQSVRPDWSRAVARDVLGVEPLEIGGGHFPMFDRSNELAALLERAFEELS